MLGHCSCNQFKKSLNNLLQRTITWLVTVVYIKQNKFNTPAMILVQGQIWQLHFSVLKKAINYWKLASCTLGFLKITYWSSISRSSNSLGNLFNHFDIFLRDIIERYCFPQPLTTNYNCRFVQESVSDYNCSYCSFTVGYSLRYRMDPAHQSFCYTKVLMALQFTAFFCQMDDHIGVTVPSNSCKSAIDCTRFSGSCLARACLHKEYANSCLLLKDWLRWNVKKPYSTLPYIFKTTMTKKR